MIPIAEPTVGEAERTRIASILASGQLADGPEVRRFEADMAERVRTEHGVATSNGTTALHAALVALGIGDGDRVLTTPFSFVATANAARLAGADVGFVDVDPDTLTLDPDALARSLEEGERVDAVIVVHLYGLSAEMDRLLELKDRYEFDLIEDAAQAHGATYRGSPVGSIGDVGCFSFYPTKNVTAGEGGMITTNDADVADRARRFIDHGRTEGYEHAEVGHNFRLSSIHAAIGRAQLQRLDAFTSARRAHARTLTEQLADTPVQLPVDPTDRTHVFHQYTIRHPERDRIQRVLAEREIGSAVYYPTPIHEQPAYEDVAATAPVAETVAREVLSLPVHPGLSDADLDHIVAALAEALEVPA